MQKNGFNIISSQGNENRKIQSFEIYQKYNQIKRLEYHTNEAIQ